MNFKVFFVLDDDDPHMDEINQFIESVSVISIDKHYSDTKRGWSIFITYRQKHPVEDF